MNTLPSELLERLPLANSEQRRLSSTARDIRANMPTAQRRRMATSNLRKCYERLGYTWRWVLSFLSNTRHWLSTHISLVSKEAIPLAFLLHDTNRSSGMRHDTWYLSTQWDQNHPTTVKIHSLRMYELTCSYKVFCTLCNVLSCTKETLRHRLPPYFLINVVRSHKVHD